MQLTCFNINSVVYNTVYGNVNRLNGGEYLRIEGK